MPAATAIMRGTVRTTSAAVAGGPTSSPKTSSVPMDWKLPITAAAIKTSKTACALPGRIPNSSAFCLLKDSARNGRYMATETMITIPPRIACCTRSALVTPKASPNRIVVRLPVYESTLEMITTPSASIPTKSRPIAVSSLSFVCRLTTSIPATMTAAATAAPSAGLTSSTTAAAMPGTTP